MKRLLYVLTPLILVFSQNALAQYIGPNAVLKTDLAQILADPVDDEYVKLQGYLIKKLSSDKYLFSDGEKQIRVEIDQFLFPTQPFDDKDLIEIEGEVEKDFLESAEIDVDRLTIVNS